MFKAGFKKIAVTTAPAIKAPGAMAQAAKPAGKLPGLPKMPGAGTASAPPAVAPLNNPMPLPPKAPMGQPASPPGAPVRVKDQYGRVR